MSAYAWALGRALHFAVATAIVALVASAVFAGSDAERFATTAYLAAIAAALILILRWFVRGVQPLEPRRGPIFAEIFTFALWLALFVIVGVTLGSQPGLALEVLAASLGLIGAAALVRGGAIGTLRARLSQGDRLGAATRYAVAIAIAALAAGVFFKSLQSEALARLAYLAAIVATAAIAASLIAPTRAGAEAQRLYARAAELSATPASASIFARTAAYGAATAIAAILLASLLPEQYSERFATAAYLALLFTVLGIAMRWHLHNTGVDPQKAVRTLGEPLKLAASAVALALLGAALAFSYVAETMAIVVSLYAIGYAIAKSARMTTAQ